MFLCFPSVFFPSSSLGLLSPYLRTWLSASESPPDLCPFCPSTSLCSGDSTEQRSAAAWQRASSFPPLSGDHQRDLHPRAGAKLAGGLPQGHTRHYGVCVVSPIHPRLSSPASTGSLLSECSNLLAVTPEMLRFMTIGSIPISVVSAVTFPINQIALIYCWTFPCNKVSSRLVCQS